MPTDPLSSVMSMSHTPDYRSRRIAKAIDSVKAAHNTRRLFEGLEDGHRLRTPENDGNTKAFLEDTIRSAMGYGYPVEAVAVAASMTVDEVRAIAEGSAAA